ncbi:hypothetical protein ASPWEDRAFT_109176 [Aspergillus wentii DTO 134E9]|uniref:SHSP domain-containing protein n=1 Tax=Aspergillus wentii DTO 134E9 TaxID=1073089 RepID=A0A1L9RND0_ASPWE|nr:uncharacterized protein ASPWEDRAFT_109176 [Aspergillus wentii DTO 134E9]KAI9926094.1 heat shock protein [Aspergillus wentii]OJJ36440.1 hypothetical protein ASPWEDRAFT_109176 [Aspergillus wentii DTO 134E9]
MSLFRTIPTGGDFAPLFRLLDDYDVHRSNKQTSVRSFSPRFDVRESEDGYHLDGELPGVDQKDIDIEFSDPQTLVIKGRVERSTHTESDDSEPQSEGEKQVSKTDSKHRYWATERSVGEFLRTFAFPTRVDQDSVKASLKNGILSVTVPKSTTSGTKKITIE